MSSEKRHKAKNLNMCYIIKGSKMSKRDKVAY